MCVLFTLTSICDPAYFCFCSINSLGTGTVFLLIIFPTALEPSNDCRVYGFKIQSQEPEGRCKVSGIQGGRGHPHWTDGQRIHVLLSIMCPGAEDRLKGPRRKVASGCEGCGIWLSHCKRRCPHLVVHGDAPMPAGLPHLDLEKGARLALFTASLFLPNAHSLVTESCSPCCSWLRCRHPGPTLACRPPSLLSHGG